MWPSEIRCTKVPNINTAYISQKRMEVKLEIYRYFSPRPEAGSFDSGAFIGLEHVSAKTVVAHLLYPPQLVLEHPGQELGPDDPVEESDAKDGPATDGMRPVGKGVVGLSARGGLDERDDEQEHVDGAEEESSDEGGGFDRWPVGVRAVSEVYDTEGDKSVDD